MLLHGVGLTLMVLCRVGLTLMVLCRVGRGLYRGAQLQTAWMASQQGAPRAQRALGGSVVVVRSPLIKSSSMMAGALLVDRAAGGG